MASRAQMKTNKGRVLIIQRNTLSQTNNACSTGRKRSWCIQTSVRLVPQLQSSVMTKPLFCVGNETFWRILSPFLWFWSDWFRRFSCDKSTFPNKNIQIKQNVTQNIQTFEQRVLYLWDTFPQNFLVIPLGNSFGGVIRFQSQSNFFHNPFLAI